MHSIKINFILFFVVVVVIIHYSAEHLDSATSNQIPATVMPQLPPEPAGRCSNKLQVFKRRLFSV